MLAANAHPSLASALHTLHSVSPRTRASQRPRTQSYQNNVKLILETKWISTTRVECLRRNQPKSPTNLTRTETLRIVNEAAYHRYFINSCLLPQEQGLRVQEEVLDPRKLHQDIRPKSSKKTLLMVLKSTQPQICIF